MIAFTTYLIADVIGIVCGLLLYDWVSDTDWPKLYRRAKRKANKWMQLKRKELKPRRYVRKKEGNDVY